MDLYIYLLLEHTAYLIEFTDFYLILIWFRFCCSLLRKKRRRFAYGNSRLYSYGLLLLYLGLFVFYLPLSSLMIDMNIKSTTYFLYQYVGKKKCNREVSSGNKILRYLENQSISPLQTYSYKRTLKIQEAGSLVFAHSLIQLFTYLLIYLFYFLILKFLTHSVTLIFNLLIYRLFGILALMLNGIGRILFIYRTLDFIRGTLSIERYITNRGNKICRKKTNLFKQSK